MLLFSVYYHIESLLYFALPNEKHNYVYIILLYIYMLKKCTKQYNSKY